MRIAATEGCSRVASGSSTRTARCAAATVADRFTNTVSRDSALRKNSWGQLSLSGIESLTGALAASPITTNVDAAGAVAALAPASAAGSLLDPHAAAPRSKVTIAVAVASIAGRG